MHTKTLMAKAQKTMSTNSQRTLFDMFKQSAPSSAASSPPPSSPPESTMPSSPVSLAASTPLPETSTAVSPSSSPAPSLKLELEEEDEEELSEEDKEKWARLEPFLVKVQRFTRHLKMQMDAAKTSRDVPEKASESTKFAKKGKSKRFLDDPVSSRSSKRAKTGEAATVAVEANSEEAKTSDESSTFPVFTQSVLVTGTKLKPYQLEGVAWMFGLYSQGISGILADEMGLGKTLQTIAFHAKLRERSPAPWMVVCPLSVLNNWADEFKKFAPDIPVCIYHGSRDEREELRRTQMVIPERDRDKWFLGPANLGYAPPAGKVGKPKAKSAPPPKVSTSKSKQPTNTKKLPARSTRGKKAVDSSDEDGQAAKKTQDEDGMSDLPPNQRTTFPVVLTTYEIVMRDNAELSMYKWGFVVVDEGHRLKNMECRLMRELKSLPATGRMVLTGTPLHNNLAELWSLLNFVLPDVFKDLDTFQDWFSLPSTASYSSSSPRATRLINTLHAILRPFLLRRLKVDVETSLPPKKEYVLYAPLSVKQREVYDAVLNGHLRALLLKAGKIAETPAVVKDDEENEGPRQSRRRVGRAKRRKYDQDGDDDEYFQKLENGELEAEKARQKNTKTAEELGREWQYKTQLKKVNNMKLQNTVMQLRKVCSHPFLFDWPVDPNTRQPTLDAELVSASGKMMLLDQLLSELFHRQHKVLLFSQFTTMLDIIEDWATELKGWTICRIDGSTPMNTRREEVSRFQGGGDDPDAPRLFLLSTRAGGLGLNLVAADTVIFYDQDWNPQMDLQAQDRAHRIGQTRAVLIFRLVSAHTIETKIMQRATEKRKLEALVIAKGQFRAPNASLGGPPAKNKHETMAEIAASLLRLEGEQIRVALEGQSVISEKDLDVLLDRSPEVFVDRGKGWKSGAPGEGGRDAGSKTAFAVYDAPVDEGGDALAGMMGEDIE